jgi:hypothetical protein
MKMFDGGEIQKNGKALWKQARFLKSPLSMMKGLMLARKVKVTLVFCFRNEKRLSFHMFFVFCPIDIIFLGKDKTVVEIKEGFRPFSAYKTRKKAMYAIEAKEGSVREKGIAVGDVLQFRRIRRIGKA